MKKAYIKPTTEVFKIETPTLLMGSGLHAFDQEDPFMESPFNDLGSEVPNFENMDITLLLNL